jgi:hypothetical protein
MILYTLKNREVLSVEKMIVHVVVKKKIPRFERPLPGYSVAGESAVKSAALYAAETSRLRQSPVAAGLLY